MRRVLLDTNGYSALAQGDKAVLDALSEADAVVPGVRAWTRDGI